MTAQLTPARPEPGVYKLQSLIVGENGPLYVTLVDPKDELLTSWPAESSKEAGQKWQVAHLGGGQYSIIGYTTGLSISLKNGAQKQAKAASLPPSDRTARWTFDARDTPDSKNYYIRNVSNPDQVIDLEWSWSKPGSKILIWTKNTPLSNNQTWKLVPV